jgi:hypothetical protein
MATTREEGLVELPASAKAHLEEWYETSVIHPLENFQDPKQEWRRLFSELLGTFFLALAGLDAGSAFGGMGSSREVAVAALAWWAVSLLPTPESPMILEFSVNGTGIVGRI